MIRNILLFLVLIFCVNVGFSQELNYSTLDISLIQEIEQFPNSNFNVYIILEDKVDVKSLDNMLTARKANQKIRSKTIISALQKKSKSSQENLLNQLNNHAGVDKNSIKSYWLANVIFFNANAEALAYFSNSTDVEFIGLDGEILLVESIDEGSAAFMPDGKEQGLSRINAEAMWELGYTGYGQLALVADTGIDPTHNSFAHRYRGNTTTDEQSWYQWNNQSSTPFQCGDHGTHVLGTVLGLDRSTSDTIGVAFDAQWMGAANLCGGGTQSNVGAFQWAANPDGDLDTTDDMADVINNSWWDPSVSGIDCNSIYVDVLVAVEAIGVVVVFSAGNAGPDPESITSPHNINVELVNSFTVAALNGNSPNLPIADFSSRGPSICGGEGALAIKPEVAAPGQGVRSAVLENEYGLKSGTSMAAPHVSGAILLLKQAFPDATGKDLKLALYYTCRDLGEPGEDNTYGQGIIDVYQAYLYLIDEGYVPVPAVNDNDLIAYGIITDRFECSESLTGEFVFFNNSPDTLHSMEINIILDENIDDQLSSDWTGVLAPYQMDTISIVNMNIEAGAHQLAVEISKPNGNDDSRVLNNRISKQILISAKEKIEIANIENQVSCEGASMLVQAIYDGDGQIQWFDQEQGGNMIGAGTQFATETDNLSTIYGDVLRKRNLGKVVFDDDKLTLSNDKDEGLVFNAAFPLRITAFDFYSEQAGNIFIAVEDGRGDQIESELIPTDGSGWQTANVSIRIPEGFNYSILYKDGVAPFGISSDNIDFPYILDDIMTITGSDNGLPIYKYFFNIQVEFLDLCGRVPVEINSVETDSLPLAKFNVSVNQVDLENNQSISFFNSSTNASDFRWSFGDGNSSIEENPNHTYEEVGIYFPSLIVRNAEGCDDAFVQRVEIFSSAAPNSVGGISSSNDIAVSPNPASNRVVFSSLDPVFIEKIVVYNSAGQPINTYSVSERLTFKSIDLNDLGAGLYFFVIHTANGANTHKVLKF